MPCDHEAVWESLEYVAMEVMCAEGSEVVIDIGSVRQLENDISPKYFFLSTTVVASRLFC
jgi:hypothetical protein